ncbi:MAG: hypothetical protein A2Y02_03310 [Omnitrophica bacterium GWA2_52_12]|nr:MAG: hypothetical protein A2Y02_03310 [Omnitrophica bacterium GWA2_52_12]
MKDYYDVWLLMRQFNFNGASLAGAIARTFKNRKTELPKALPFFAAEIYSEQSDKNKIWQAFLEKNARRTPQKLREAAAAIESFLRPVVQTIIAGTDFKSDWKAPGPWNNAGQGAFS